MCSSQNKILRWKAGGPEPRPPAFLGTKLSYPMELILARAELDKTARQAIYRREDTGYNSKKEREHIGNALSKNSKNEEESL
mgnify:FL=1